MRLRSAALPKRTNTTTTTSLPNLSAVATPARRRPYLLLLRLSIGTAARFIPRAHHRRRHCRRLRLLGLPDCLAHPDRARRSRPDKLPHALLSPVAVCLSLPPQFCRCEENQIPPNSVLYTLCPPKAKTLSFPLSLSPRYLCNCVLFRRIRDAYTYQKRVSTLFLFSSCLTFEFFSLLACKTCSLAREGGGGAATFDSSSDGLGLTRIAADPA